MEGPVQPKISIENLSKVFPMEKGKHLLVLKDVTASVNSNEFVAIVGPSGCGKSTLLYMIGGFVSPTEGTILKDGAAISTPGRDRGIVFQHFALFPWRTVLGNVLYSLEERRIPGDERKRIAMRYIRLVQLEGFENAYPYQLSGGMKQRVAIARALASDPDVLLMDEPFGALDAQTRRLMQDELLRIWSSDRKTVLFVTHDVREAVYLAQRVIVMTARPGRIKAVIDTDLPTKDKLEEGPQFHEKTQLIWNLVREEL